MTMSSSQSESRKKAIEALRRHQQQWTADQLAQRVLEEIVMPYLPPSPGARAHCPYTAKKPMKYWIRLCHVVGSPFDWELLVFQE